MKNILVKTLTLFSIISTSIFLCASVYSFFIFGGKSSFSIFDIWAIFSIGAISALVSIPFLLELELKKAAILVLQLLHFFIINLYTLTLGYLRHWFNFNNLKTVVAMEITILAVYMITSLIEFLKDNADAKKMNDIISRRKQPEK